MKVMSFLVLAVLVSAIPAFAHSPYFGRREKFELPEFGEVELAVLYGDGVIIADPRQVVVFDNEGYLLAATPVSYAFIIRCDLSNEAQRCSIYDEPEGLVYRPDLDRWERRRTIVEDDRPSSDAYPESMDVSYGFTARPATFAEKISFEVAGIAQAPLATLFAILWWCLAVAPMARLGWRWRGNGWSIRPVRFFVVSMLFLSVIVFLVMGFLAIFTRLYLYYTFLFFLFVSTTGGTLAFVITRPRGRRAARQTS